MNGSSLDIREAIAAAKAKCLAEEPLTKEEMA